MKKFPFGAIPLFGGILVILIATVVIYSLFSRSLQDNFGDRQPNYETSDPLITKVLNGETITEPTISETDPILGPNDAKVKLVVFSDFACPYCKVIATQLEKQVANNSDVAVVWKDFPITSLHPTSGNAHIAARCAFEQGKFWEYHDALFANPSDFARSTLLSIARNLELNQSKFNTCLSSTEPIDQVAQGIQEGNALNIDGTPYIFVNDQRISGLVTEQELEQVINLHRQLSQ